MQLVAVRTQKAVVQYPNSLPHYDGMVLEQGELERYTADYSKAVAALCGGVATGNCIAVAGRTVEISIYYYDGSCRGSVWLRNSGSALRGWNTDWVIRKGVVVKPETVAKQIKEMARCEDLMSVQQAERERIVAVNAPMQRRLEAGRTGTPVIAVSVSASDSEEGKVHVILARQSHLCTEAQAARLLTLLDSFTL